MNVSSRGVAGAMCGGLIALFASGCGGVAPEEASAPAARAAFRSKAATAIDPHTLHKNAGVYCTVCHTMHGGMAGTALIGFSSVAYAPGQPPPSFDPVAKTCSNIACHMVPAGTYQYFVQDAFGDAVAVSVGYGGVPVTTPPWYAATTGGCVSCHSDPPSPPAGAWHSGWHADGSAAMNACDLCHPDVTVVDGELALTTDASLHRNGVVDVAPRWKSTCFGCH